LSRFVTIKRDVLHAQTKGCWLAVQVGFTLVCLHGWWNKWQGVRVELGAPVHDPETGYWCTRWGFDLSTKWRGWYVDVPRSLAIGRWN
jgi:hypothetical protein